MSEPLRHNHKDSRALSSLEIEREEKSMTHHTRKFYLPIQKTENKFAKEFSNRKKKKEKGTLAMKKKPFSLHGHKKLPELVI